MPAMIFGPKAGKIFSPREKAVHKLLARCAPARVLTAQNVYFLQKPPHELDLLKRGSALPKPPKPVQVQREREVVSGLYTAPPLYILLKQYIYIYKYNKKSRRSVSLPHQYTPALSYLQVYRDNYVCKPYDRRECKFYRNSPGVLGMEYRREGGLVG